MKYVAPNLPGLEPRGVALVERVQEIKRAPDIEYPGGDYAGPTWQQEQRHYGEYCRNEVSVSLGSPEPAAGERYNAGDQGCQPEEAEAVQHQHRPQRVRAVALWRSSGQM